VVQIAVVAAVLVFHASPFFVVEIYWEAPQYSLVVDHRHHRHRHYYYYY